MHPSSLTDKAGFSLVEILVVISILGLLAASVFVPIIDLQLNTKYTQAEAEMKLIAEAMSIAGGGVTPIGTITNHWCSACACRDLPTGTDLGALADTNSCVSLWRSALTRLANDSLLLSDVQGLARDPWQSPYLLDQNEGEYVAPNYCRRDLLWSAGADRLYQTADDFYYVLPYRTPQCKSLN